MAPVIWGLDLKEMQWWKFKGSYMFNQVYHLRRTKMIVYQIAMILCVCSESVGTAALADYVDQQEFVEAHSQKVAAEYNDDFVGIASYNIFVGIAVATIFGAAFFFDLFWPERRESKSVHLAWKISAVVVTIMTLADAIALTVIVATRSAHITGVDAEIVTQLLIGAKPAPLKYRRNGRCVASAVLLWVGFPAVVASTVILFLSHAHDAKYGPKAAHIRKEEEMENMEMQNGQVSSDMEAAGAPAAAAAAPLA
ncbi:MAG: hypothetical protein M1818_001656 [Claussenomyces sp. TS43310]|nr:MAG: hypothetical protein M1818_001656 [Claussenomyces sp. TS43310]